MYTESANLNGSNFLRVSAILAYADGHIACATPWTHSADETWSNVEYFAIVLSASGTGRVQLSHAESVDTQKYVNLMKKSKIKIKIARQRKKNILKLNLLR